MLVHFLISITDGDYGILQISKGSSLDVNEYQLHDGESVTGSAPAWVKYMQNPSAYPENEISDINLLFYPCS